MMIRCELRGPADQASGSIVPLVAILLRLQPLVIGPEVHRVKDQ